MLRTPILVTKTKQLAKIGLFFFPSDCACQNHGQQQAKSTNMIRLYSALFLFPFQQKIPNLFQMPKIILKGKQRRNVFPDVTYCQLLNTSLFTAIASLKWFCICSFQCTRMLATNSASNNAGDFAFSCFKPERSQDFKQTSANH